MMKCHTSELMANIMKLRVFKNFDILKKKYILLIKPKYTGEKRINSIYLHVYMGGSRRGTEGLDPPPLVNHKWL